MCYKLIDSVYVKLLILPANRKRCSIYSIQISDDAWREPGQSSVLFDHMCDSSDSPDKNEAIFSTWWQLFCGASGSFATSNKRITNTAPLWQLEVELNRAAQITEKKNTVFSPESGNTTECCNVYVLHLIFLPMVCLIFLKSKELFLPSTYFGFLLFSSSSEQQILWPSLNRRAVYTSVMFISGNGVLQKRNFSICHSDGLFTQNVLKRGARCTRSIIKSWTQQPFVSRAKQCLFCFPEVPTQQATHCSKLILFKWFNLINWTLVILVQCFPLFYNR